MEKKQHFKEGEKKEPKEEELEKKQQEIREQIIERVSMLRDPGVFRMELLEIHQERNDILNEFKDVLVELGQKFLDKQKESNETLKKLKEKLEKK